MRGREVYATAEPLIKVAEFTIRMVPRPIANLLLIIARPIPTTIGIGLRYVLLRRLAKTCGECVSIRENVYLLNPENLSLGDHISIHPMCYLDAFGGLAIRNNVSIAHGVSIITTNHSCSSTEHYIRDAPLQKKPVIIGDDVWIGCGVKILAGTTIGNRSVVGAGAVVTKELPPASVSLGVPAKPIKDVHKKAA